MINSQPKLENPVQKLKEEIMNISQALVKVREAEIKLHEIKFRLESFSNAFQETEQRRLKILKNQSVILQAHKDFETIVLEHILPHIRSSKTRIDPALYRNYLKKESLLSSIKLFRDEVSSILKDSTYLQSYKSYQDVFREPEKGLIEFPYDFLIGVLEFLAIKEKFLIIRFEKSFEFHELPESFFISLVRVDLMTITLTFRKLPSSLSKAPNQRNETGDDKSKGHANRVVLFNIVYSNAFDHDAEKVNLHSKKEPFNIHWKCASTDDEDIRNLVQVVKENQSRINLPCLYPGMAVFQRFSFYITEKIEKLYNAYHAQINAKTDRLEEILTNIIKNYSEEFTESVAGKCFFCRKKFAMDSKSQKMLPPLSMRDRKEKVGPGHIGCRKLLENTEGESPQIIVKVDCADESDLFLQNIV